MDLKKLILATLVAGLCSLAFAEGAVSYTLHKSENPTEDELDAYERIATVMDSAVYLYNKYTNLTKFINVYYAPGVPTAEASSNGDLRFGSERSYMFVGTAMHEMAHTMGMGTTTEYRSMFKDKVFQGPKTQALLKEIDGPDAELHGDDQHFWPYGLNYASEVHSEQDLINHARIVDMMYQEIFKEAFYAEGHLKNISTGKCMGITENNALQMMDCADTATFIKMFSVGEPVAYRIQLGRRSLDVPNESTAAGATLSTYGYNGGSHQKMYKDAVDPSDTTVFYLRIVKSDLYVMAGEVNLTQDVKSGNDKEFQWTFVIPSKESSVDAISHSLNHVRPVRPGKKFDLKGRSIPVLRPNEYRVILGR